MYTTCDGTDETQTLGTTGVAATSPSSSSNAIQLFVKEEAGDVYRWVSSSDGTINLTLKALCMEVIIKTCLRIAEFGAKNAYYLL